MKVEGLRILRRRGIVGVYVALALLMVIGTVFDMQINTILYDKTNWFGVWIAHYGLYPAVLCTFVTAAIFGRLLLLNRKDWLSGGCLLWNLYMAYQSGREFVKLFAKDSTMVKLLPLGIGFLLAVVLAMFVFVRMDVSDATYVRAIAMTILFAFSAQFLLINKVIKVPWGRPRFRTLIVTEGMDFRPWYQAGLTDVARQLIATGMSADEWKSFPSGHAGCAAALVMLAYLSKLIPQWKDKELLFTVIGIAWSLATILGRMIAGAHFLTDVAFATCITWTAFVVCAKIFSRERTQ